MNLVEDDLVLVIGSTISRDGEIESHRALASVIAVGKRDVFVKQDGYSNKPFKVPVKKCIKVSDKQADPTAKIVTPKLDNLVMSVTARFGEVKRRTGVLIEIIDVPGQPLMAKLLMGEKNETVSFDSLIVLE